MAANSQTCLRQANRGLQPQTGLYHVAANLRMGRPGGTGFKTHPRHSIILLPDYSHSRRSQPVTWTTLPHLGGDTTLFPPPAVPAHNATCPHLPTPLRLPPALPVPHPQRDGRTDSGGPNPASGRTTFHPASWPGGGGLWQACSGACLGGKEGSWLKLSGPVPNLLEEEEEETFISPVSEQ